MNNQSDLAGYLPMILFLVVAVFPIIAALVAPPDRRGTFFLLTLFVLPGPLRVACAAIAQSRRVYTSDPPAPSAPAASQPKPSAPTSPTPAASPPRTAGVPAQENSAFVPGRWGLDWRNPFK